MGVPSSPNAAAALEEEDLEWWDVAEGEAGMNE